eukprot:scaffold479941_cov71-Attheya_sp.AAC.1
MYLISLLGFLSAVNGFGGHAMPGRQYYVDYNYMYCSRATSQHARTRTRAKLTGGTGRCSTATTCSSGAFIASSKKSSSIRHEKAASHIVRMRQSDDADEASAPSSERLRSIYLLYTGGTIGSVSGSDGGGLKPANLTEFKSLLGSISQLGKSGITDLNLNDDTEQNIDVDYTLDVMDPPLDSTEMVPKNWYQIALQILRAFKENPAYDGAVVLHGTDTMAYTSSALAFLLKGLTKPVVVTGSQIPLVKPRSDALRNFVSSVAVSAEGSSQGLNEVMIVFGSRILRGCRATKINADAFSGFDTPNYPHLGINGLAIEFDGPSLLKLPKDFPWLLDTPDKIESRMASLKKSSDTKLDNFSVVAVHLYPGINETTVASMLSDTTRPVKGIVVRSYGAGNVPENISGKDGPLAAAHKKGAVIVDTTQVLAGHVSIGTYAASVNMAKISVSGAGMTTESAISKLVSIFANPEMYTTDRCPPRWDKDPTRFQEFAESVMKKSVVGEIGSTDTLLT